MQCDECCICLEYLDKDLKILPCKHVIHNKCILKMKIVIVNLKINVHYVERQ